jgi:hypothetical protein
MTDYATLKRLSIDDLLNRAIDQGNGASRQEIKSRQMAMKPIPKLGDYLLAELMKSRGVERAQPVVQDSGNDLAEIDISDDPDMICVMARKCLRDGFSGQNMRDPDRAKSYIKMAADNPRVMDELPDSGMAFWKSASFNYRLWMSEHK